MSQTARPFEVPRPHRLRPITEVGEAFGLLESELISYGPYKAKISLDVLKRLKSRPDGRLIVVTAITPTRAGEGKTTSAIGLTQGLGRIGTNVALCLRQPSTGPLFGIKGGGAGGGMAQIVPMEEINLHFTGDIHAVEAAHNLLAAVIDAQLFHGTLEIGPSFITWPRTLDVNDRALRHIVTGLGASARLPSLKLGTHSTSARGGGEPNPLTMIRKSLNHSGTDSLLDQTLRNVLQRLGSSDPTPGGGAAAALVGALGAALVEMTANLTIGRRRFADVEERARQIEQRAAELRQKLGQLGDADAEAFERVSAAYKLPHADDSEKAARSQAIQAALLLAAEIPLETARLSAQVTEIAEQAAPILNPAVISDVLVGTVLAQAALASAALNVEINLAAMTDAAAVERFASDLARVRDGVDERVERTLAAGRSRFPTA